MSRPVDAARLALGTLTVVPVPPPRSVDRGVAALAMALAPVAVLPVAALAGGVVWLGGALSAPPLLTAVLTMALLAVATGGLHLDGLADTADGLAVPGGQERRLEVMRTGDVGPVGVATVLLVVLVQVAALSGVVAGGNGADAALTAGLAVVASRCAVPLACSRVIPAARADGLGSAVAGSVAGPSVLLVLAGVAAAAGLVQGGRGVAGVAVAAAGVAVVLLRARRRLGGVTGDVIGAAVEVALACYLAAQVVHPSGLW